MGQALAGSYFMHNINIIIISEVLVFILKIHMSFNLLMS